MPVEAKPLFRPDVLRSHVASFTLPPVDAAKLSYWASEIASGQIDRHNEKQILPHFLTDFFVGLLGYVGPAGRDRYTLRYEHHLEVDGKFADAVLGQFNGESRYDVVVEGKGPGDPLDRPFAGRKVSAVDQAYDYAINLRCDWILVTSIKQIRLYHKGSDKQTFERFEVARLAHDEETLRRFVFLLGAERVSPERGRPHFYELLAESEKVGRELTKEFYVNYANMRQDAFETLARDNALVPRRDVLAATQKLLDRVLFVAFCEDRGLLPRESIKQAYSHRDLYNPRPIWQNFKGLFGAIDRGNEALNIHAYNGGLFAPDPVLDALDVSDEVCGYFKELGDYDYKPAHEASGETKVVDVDILGHIFEQSITDLERLRNEVEGLASPVAVEAHKSRRKKEGAFYTPAFITRYIVEQALGGALRERFEKLRIERQYAAKGAARKALADPSIYDLQKLPGTAREGLVEFWEAWQDELAKVRVLDPACGSGAFLIEAFDHLHAAYRVSNDRLLELRGRRSLFDPDKRILENNLYGVDLNEEAIEICRLSLWIKTAERGKALTSLDHTIRVGNSVVADASIHPRAFDWQAAFPEVFAEGGFDVVVGNPPYVRQELLSEFKPYLQSAYRSYHGMADLYVYFYELGLRVLRPGGLLSFIVTNKWMKAGYGEPLRRFFSERAWIESVVDFGHAKQIFADADVFPSILVARKPDEKPKPVSVRLCSIPREQLRVEDLSRQIDEEGLDLSPDRLSHESWQLEPNEVGSLMAKIDSVGTSLREAVGSKPVYGLKTGCNDAFFIDEESKNALVAENPASQSLFLPYLRGQDVDRWRCSPSSQWLVALKSSSDVHWPWTDAGSDSAEEVFRDAFPAVHAHMRKHEAALKGRKTGFRHWWELGSFKGWDTFARPKLIYQEIQFHPCYALDDRGYVSNNKTFVLPTGDLYLLAILNSPLMWWRNWRSLPHMKDEALTPAAFLMESLPVANASPKSREQVCMVTLQVIEATESRRAGMFALLDWLRVEHGVEKPSQKLLAATELDSDAFVAEVKRLRGKKNPLSAAGLKSLRDEYVRTIEPAKARAAEALALERRLGDLVNEAYGLTPEEVDLMWKTAPPRMPYSR